MKMGSPQKESSSKATKGNTKAFFTSKQWSFNLFFFFLKVGANCSVR